MQPTLADELMELLRRMLCIETNMGILPRYFFVEGA